MEKKDPIVHWDDLPDVLSAQNIADFLGLSRRRIYELFELHPEHGGIRNFSIGKSKRVDKKDFKAWLDDLKNNKVRPFSA